jgi:small-conductance mechanosensitive channel
MAAWLEVTMNIFYLAWQRIVEFLPNFLAAILVFIVGWLISAWIKKLIVKILNALKLDRILEKSGWKEALEKAEIKVSVSDFCGEIVKWILVILFLMAAVEIVGLTQFSEFLGKILSWLPNLIAAVIIFIVAVVAADILGKIVKASVKKIGTAYIGIIEGIVKISIYVFAIFAILLQLGIAKDLVNAIIYGVIFALSLGFGLAFGLGGKDTIAKFIEDLRRKMEEK